MAVYVHFPWCLQKCPYCDFASEAVAPRNIPHGAYADAVVAELAARAPAFGPGAARTVFFGGGTPSLWDPAEIGRVLAAIVRAFGPADEVTVECNPTSLDAPRARALRAAGVTRLSVGVQSLRDGHLRYLGRLHDAAAALRSVAEAAAAAGDALRVSADLMFGMPDQRAAELCEDAARLIAAGARHLSVYALTIEPATRFGELARKGRLPRLPDDDVAGLYEAVETALGVRGWEHYEVSNYAAAAGERARHNVAYWRGEAYVGLGAGAVGCYPCAVGTGAAARAVRYRNGADVAAYTAGCARGAPPGDREDLTADVLAREGLMLGLRTSDGVDLAGLARVAGVDPRAGRQAAIARQVARGNLVDAGAGLTIPPGRWLLADDIVAALF